MTWIPRATLSEHFQERLAGRRLLGAAFLTYQFDPAFFEQDVLPVFLDIPVSHAPRLRLSQLESALQDMPHGISVFYDANGLVAENGPAKLDVRRVPVAHPTGVFHPKNVFALVEDDAIGDGERERSLLVATMSANLTRGGWWHNVEVCHVEELTQGDETRLKDDLRRFVNSLERQVRGKSPQGSAILAVIREFLRGTYQRTHRSRGRLFTHYYDGKTTVPDFLASAAGARLKGMNLEIISPYFDASPKRLPLKELCDRFSPREVRVYLPRNNEGEPLCTREVLEHVRGLSDPATSWGRLPAELVKIGKGGQAKERTVHAKVYRFFSRTTKTQIMFLGSVNLTSAAHGRGGNLESGVLVEFEGTRRSDWWLTPEAGKAAVCAPREEADEGSAHAGTLLNLRYSWSRKEAEVYWDATRPSPPLTVRCQGVDLFPLTPLAPRTWEGLPPGHAELLERALESTSILEVHIEGQALGHLLVQEEEMHARPSLAASLSPAEILQSWTLLTKEQRTEFLEAVGGHTDRADEGEPLTAPVPRQLEKGTIFDRFAGIFLAFEMLERSILDADREKNPRHVTYRLFGNKHDSLPALLGKLDGDANAGEVDLVEQYVTILCARQLVDTLEPSLKELFQKHRTEVRQLKEALALQGTMRRRLEEVSDEMPEFLDWFDQWFLKRAQPREVVEA